MRVKRVLAPALMLALFATLLVQLPLAIADRSSVYESFDPIVDIRRILLDRYVEPPDEEAMYRAMIDAMVATVDDPYTQYIPPALTSTFNKQLRGKYAGIGAEVNDADGYLSIVTPMDDSPALRAGVMAGDLVLEIEGESTFEVPISESVDKLLGEAGTEVGIRVRHLDGSEEDLTIVRDHIVTRTVKGMRRRGEAWNYCVDETLGLCYVRVTQFNEATVVELRAALEECRARGLGGLVLDLRDNPGGGLPAAVGISDLFLDEGTILTVRPRVGDEVRYTAKAPGTLPPFPMVVLVNGNSASASEIVAGALQENGRAKVLGLRTYGKGSVQEVRTLRYGGGLLKFTTAHYYLPSGRNLNRSADSETWGVDPDPGLVVPVTDEAYLEAFRARREQGVIRAPEDGLDACVSAAWIRAELRDEQLALAVEALGVRAAGGPWSTVSEAEAGRMAFEQELERELSVRRSLLDRLRHTDEQIGEIRGRAGRPPLLPPDVELVDGTVTVTDRHGNVVGSYRIQGGDLALALETARLAPLEAGNDP